MESKTIERACTSILVGKKASIDGSTMIARNDDTFLTIAPHNFLYHPAAEHETEHRVKSYLNGFEATVPANNYSWTAVPNVAYKTEGYYDESGINGKNVAMSATESTYGNERALAYDPLVTDGLDEDCMLRMVLPFIDSARAGVQLLGEIIALYGSVAGNSVLFSDKNHVWYMELVTGHHWVAQRIPDDAYAICSNRVSIQQVDFTDTENFMWSEGIQEFVEINHLNPDKTGFNFRHIFGTSNLKDRHYNNPRVWYGQRYFNPEIVQDPEDHELPFICRTSHKITLEDIQYLLGSHYNETNFDPLGSGSQQDKLRYRPIGLNRTQNSHVLQLRNDVPEAYSALMWLCIGFPTFSPYLPFYTNMTETPASYRDVPETLDLNYSYWFYRTMSMLVEAHYSDFLQENIDYLTSCRQYTHGMIAQTDKLAQDHSEDLAAFLTSRNALLSKDITEKTTALMQELILKGINLSKLTFDMDKNL
ncbi:peptidase C69 [Enterococcus canis]|uniref:Dipeptidase n=1 Tax=Enterococcus canis TaxID=214095 RepID=A0A1L8RIB2_9ENTE|nr:C69 family dipeptidase [Enterococcus canis]OJG19497.1 peptidase C69 [Enterococcus canis]